MALTVIQMIKRQTSNRVFRFRDHVESGGNDKTSLHKGIRPLGDLAHSVSFYMTNKVVGVIRNSLQPVTDSIKYTLLQKENTNKFIRVDERFESTLTLADQTARQDEICKTIVIKFNNTRNADLSKRSLTITEDHVDDAYVNNHQSR